MKQQVKVRSAHESDLPGLFILDREVSYEHFKPLYEKTFSNHSLGQNAQYYLDLELQQDRLLFPACIRSEVKERLYSAYDVERDVAAGLIIAHLVDALTIQIDLMLVSAAYRRQGIGAALVAYVLKDFPGITLCIVYPLQRDNEATLSFYTSLNFKNCGVVTGDKINVYGIPYSEMYWRYELQIEFVA